MVRNPPVPVPAPSPTLFAQLWLFLLCVTTSGSLLIPASAQAPTTKPNLPMVHMNGDRITVRARENTLIEVLRELAEQGVRVRVDPAVEARVHGDLIGQPVNDALKLLLGAYGYSTRWGSVDGPVGTARCAPCASKDGAASTW